MSIASSPYRPARKVRYRPEALPSGEYIVVERLTGAIAQAGFPDSRSAWGWIANTLDAERERD